jgi:hypothetical protein
MNASDDCQMTGRCRIVEAHPHIAATSTSGRPAILKAKRPHSSTAC